ncbi:hypothetical protein [Myxosarcina sp. GI1]|uniref:hypothetical protein n=1 Tax=Myxosarcina sp. GI1 TaxID=1541065 RepID=UPI00056C5BA1|nr:hypothetical protein [Myxosarcina sp. GI1]
MFLIGLRIIILLAVAYLFGLLVAWLFAMFGNGNGGDDFRRDDPETPSPQGDPENKKRLVEVDESYYLEEFDLSKK